MAYESTIKFDELDHDAVLLQSMDTILLKSTTRSSETLLQSGLLDPITAVLHRGNSSSPKEKVISFLADASRDVQWRIPFGEVGVLRLALDLLCEGAGIECSRHCLRLVANLCADTDENRKIVLERDGITILQNILKSSQKLAPIAMVVLFNLCMDFEPAQKTAVNAGVLQLLLEFLDQALSTPGNVHSGIVIYSSRILELLVALNDAKSVCPDSAANTLLKAANSDLVAFEEYVSLIHSSGLLLEGIRFQNFMLSTCAVEIPLAILAQSYTRFADLSSENLDEDDEPQEVVLHRTRNTLIAVMSDISALDNFLDFYPLETPLVGSLLHWLSIEHTDLQICASIMLGNLARNEATCRAIVFEKAAHIPLIQCLQTQSTVGVIHAAGGMLKNLALSCIEVRDQIGRCGGIEACDKLYHAGSVAQIQYTGASLARLLIAGSSKNVARLLSPLSPDPDSPATNKSHLSLMLDMFSSSSDVPTRTEIGRTIASILRILNSSSSRIETSLSHGEHDLDLKELELRFYSLHREIARPLVEMVMQDKWPAVRSEGWFGLALLARNRLGAESASNEALEPKFYEAIFTALGRKGEWDAAMSHLSQDSSTAEAEMKETSSMSKEVSGVQDRDNVIIFISEILQNWGDNMAWMRRNILQNILEGKSLADILGEDGMEGIRPPNNEASSH